MKNINILIFIFTLSLAFSCKSPNSNATQDSTATATPSAETEAIGGSKDEHGCLSGAGYTWSILKDSCVRTFEAGIALKGMDSTNKNFNAYVVFATDESKAEVFLIEYKKGSVLLDKVAGENAGIWKNDSLQLSQWKGMYTLEKNKKMLYQGAVNP